MINFLTIGIDDIFFDVCEIQQISHSCVPRLTPKWEIDIQKKPLIDRRLSFERRYLVDGTTLQSHLIERSPFPKLAQYQIVTKIYITKWRDGLVWINLAIQQNYVGHDLHPQTQEHKITYIPMLFGSTE